MTGTRIDETGEYPSNPDKSGVSLKKSILISLILRQIPMRSGCSIL